MPDFIHIAQKNVSFKLRTHGNSSTCSVPLNTIFIFQSDHSIDGHLLQSVLIEFKK